MKRYTFTLEETQEIKAARKKNRDKNVEKRLAALEMRAEGKQNKEIREKTGFHTQYIMSPLFHSMSCARNRGHTCPQVFTSALK